MRLATLLPHVGHRQWTLSLPFTLRFQVVKQPVLLKRLEVRLVRAVWRWQRREARRQGVTAPLRGGAVVFTQWFGSMLQLTPHLVLVPEAQWAYIERYGITGMMVAPMRSQERSLGHGFINPRSQIVVRMLTRAGEPLTGGFSTSKPGINPLTGRAWGV